MTFYYFASNNTNGAYLGSYDDEDPLPSPYGNGVPTDLYTNYPDAIYTAVYCPDGLMHWDGTGWKNLFSEQRLSDYRESKISVPVTYNNGTDDITVTNDDVTRARLVGARTGATDAVLFELIDEEEYVIKWVANNGRFAVTIDDIRHLNALCFIRTEDCYAAFDTVMTNHGVTPYVFIDDAQADFDLELDD